MLDENAKLIEVVVAKQNEGKVRCYRWIQAARGKRRGSATSYSDVHDQHFFACGADYSALARRWTNVSSY